MPSPDFAQLKAVLLTTGLQQKDNGLYQVINQLLTYMSQFQNSTNTAISAAGSGSDSAATYYYAPLTDGDLVETDLIFADGECVMVQIPIP